MGMVQLVQREPDPVASRRGVGSHGLAGAKIRPISTVGEARGDPPRRANGAGIEASSGRRGLDDQSDLGPWQRAPWYAEALPSPKEFLATLPSSLLVSSGDDMT